jgi:hypothetical protein
MLKKIAKIFNIQNKFAIATLITAFVLVVIFGLSTIGITS